jgi:hypothetical protein
MKKTEWLGRALVTSPYYYCLCASEKRFKAELKRIKLKKKYHPGFVLHGASATIHFFEQGEKQLAIVCMQKDKEKTKPQLYAMLVHEATHLWQKIRENIGEAAPSNEFEAYAIQTLSQRLIEAYIEQTSKK